MQYRTYLFLIGVLLSLLTLGNCQNESSGSEASSSYPTLNAQELQDIAQSHLQQELSALGNPELLGMLIRDTMFLKEHYSRELTIYARGLEGKDRRMNLAQKRYNDAAALLAEDPENADARAEEEAALNQIQKIEENVRIVDSLQQQLANVPDQEILYYELILSYDSADASNEPVNFNLQVAPDKSVLRSMQTRRKATKGK